MNEAHLHATPESGKAFYQNFAGRGKIVMLNLLKYRDTADYRATPDLDPGTETSGREAYNTYLRAALPLIRGAAGTTRLLGAAGAFLIGPEAERWDAVLLVEYPSMEQFLSFAQSADYQKIAGHRTAALADSRLLPVRELTAG